MKLFTRNDSALIPPALLRRTDLAAFANLPHAYRNPDRDLAEPEAVRARLEALNHQPERLLEDARHLLAGYNLQRLRPEKREALTRQILQSVYPLVARIHEKSRDGASSLPESPSRREQLTAAIGVVEQLAIAWKHLFRETWHREARRYRKQRDATYRHAFRVLEMLFLEQRLRALRFQKLPRNAWVDVNHVFFAQILHDDIEALLPLTGFVGLRRRSGRSGTSAQPQASLQRLYVSIQLFGVLDVSSWPTRLFAVPDAYLDSLDTGITLRRDDGEPLAPGSLITWLNRDASPAFERPSVLAEPALQLDYTAFYNRLVQDYETIAEMRFLDSFDPRRISTPLRRLEDEDRVPVLQLMLGALRKRERRWRRHAVVGENHIPVWFGLGEVVARLQETAVPEWRHRLRSREFREAMGQAGKLALGDAGGETGGRWQLVNFSAGGILISAIDGAFGQPVVLGQLVAFLPSNEAEAPAVGYVCRLNRPQDRVVEVGITRLATEAEMGILEIPAAQGPVPILTMLLHDQDGGWYALCEPDDRLQPGLPLKLQRAGSTHPARLGELYLSKPEFNVFVLRSPGLGEGSRQKGEVR